MTDRRWQLPSETERARQQVPLEGWEPHCLESVAHKNMLEPLDLRTSVQGLQGTEEQAK